MTDTFTIVTAAEAAPDPSKHVNFVQGMVLGVDDFTQEFAYLSGRDQWLAREALGYGVLRGLRVTLEESGDGPRVRVAAGDALSVRGELICVPQDQCAYLNPWLQTNQDDPSLTRITLYVALCYRSCATDSLPIPGEPCRDDDDLMAPSRIKDSFRLTLSLTAPAQTEEDTLREFVAWLRGVLLTAAVSPTEALSLEDFAAEVRRAWIAPAGPNGEPALLSPPTPVAGVLIPGDEAHEYFRQALRIWVNELRPLLRFAPSVGSPPEDDHQDVCPSPPKDGCILLAAIDLELIQGGKGVLNVVGVRDQEAPFLLHLRMLQEWLLAGRPELLPAETVREERSYGLEAELGEAREYARADHTHGTPPLPTLEGDVLSDQDGSPPASGGTAIVTTVVAIQGTPVAPEAPDTEGQALVFEGGVWQPGTARPELVPGAEVVAEQSYGQAPDAGVELGYARADHTHGTPPLPTLEGDVQSAPASPPASPPDGEATISTTVTALQGTPVAPNKPAAGQALIFQNGAWRPGAVSANISPGPATEVRLYGQAGSAGSSAAYARADHTHGTPPAPTFAPDGDVTATVAQQTTTAYQLRATVARLAGQQVASSGGQPVAGQVLKLRPRPDGGLEWAPGDDQTGGGSSGSQVLAAGAFAVDGSELVFPFGGLKASPLSDQMVFLLTFDKFNDEGYVVTGAPIVSASVTSPHVFEYLGTVIEAAKRLFEQDDSQVANEIRDMARQVKGVLVRVQRSEFDRERGLVGQPSSVGFTVEISQYPSNDR